MKHKNHNKTITNTILTLFIILASCTPKNYKNFDGERAMDYLKYQISLGARVPGSEAHSRAVDWIQAQLADMGWETQVQTSQYNGHSIQNIVAKRGDTGPWIILGAHYDSRLHADQDPDPSKRNEPVPGANDGASGVAVLLELARTLPDHLPIQLWLVFFDAEDNGDIHGWDWILGSRAFVQQLQGKPDAVVIIDMIGDAQLNIPIERNSDPKIAAQIWAKASQLGYSDIFLSTPGYAMIDDHTPFLSAGIPAVDIIDFDYPYWHTTQDTTDKVSATSLHIVGSTLSAWLTETK